MQGRATHLTIQDFRRWCTRDLFGGAESGDPAPNHARFTFLNSKATDFYPDWKRAAADTVALLRAEAGRNPDDRICNELIGELTSRSEKFTALWAGHNVRWHTTGTKRFHHPVAGDLALDYEGLELPTDPGQTLITFTAPADSPAKEALAFLASWAAQAGPDAHSTHPEDDRSAQRNE